MTDRELLKWAAIASGLHSLFWSERDETFYAINLYDEDAESNADAIWNPLYDDGDALRLASKLQMQIDFGEEFIRVDCDQMNLVTEVVNWDRAKAARRAIVRAAAEVGKAAP